MGGRGGYYAKWNKSDRERKILYDTTYVESKKIQQTSEYNKRRSRLTDMEKKLVVTSGEREGEEGQDRSRGLRGTNYYV